MHLMGWDVDIVHRTNDHLVNADYWSRLESDLCYDPTFRQYLHLVSELHRTHPSPTNLPMKAKNMLHYRGLRTPVKHCLEGTCMDEVVNVEVDVIATALTTTIVTQSDEDFTSLCNCPVQFGSLPLQDCTHSIRGLYNTEFPALAYHATHFSWAIYGFNSGHFVSTILKQKLPFVPFWHAIPTNMVAHYSVSSCTARQFYPVQHPSLTISVVWVCKGPLMGI